jgi:Flp pilus assembly protein TadG
VEIVRSFKKFSSDERGSLSILIITLFLLLLIFSLTIVDISDAYLAKRQLTEIGDVAITRAAHAISLTRYYSGDRTLDSNNPDGSSYRVPLDCSTAEIYFQSEISVSGLRSSGISIASWSCASDQVEATIMASVPPLIALPLGIGFVTNEIHSTIGATSIIGGSR